MRSAHRGPKLACTKHLLSGLIKCGRCGASYTIMGNDRLGCAGFRERGDCKNNRTTARRHVEQRVLAALQSHLADPEMLAEYVREFHAQIRLRAAEEGKQRTALERRLGEITRAIERIVDQVVDGSASKALISRLSAMESEQEELQGRLTDMDDKAEPIARHPAPAKKYRRICSDLQAHLEQVDRGAAADTLIEKVRDLIARVDVHPRTSREPVELQLHGLLAELLVDKKETPLNAEAFRGAMVAGAGFEPATFRL